MKKICNKLICVIILITLLFNFTSSVVFAEDPPPDFVDQEAVGQEETVLTGLAAAGEFVVNGVAGIILWPTQLAVFAVAGVVHTIVTGVAYLSGTDGMLEEGFVTPYDIFFNKLNLININIFENNLSEPMSRISHNVASWYVALRTFSIVALLCVLIYIAIRMTLSTVASDEAKYKKMLIDWIASFALLFVLHYIMLITIYFSNALVKIFSEIDMTNLTSGKEIGSLTLYLAARSWLPHLSMGWGSLILYVMLIFMIFAFLIMYIKRLITVSFLMLIAPIICITYSMDKVKDGKAQALGTWLKEFIFNVLIQPFHCILYLIFATSAISMLNGTFASTILAILFFKFIWDAEGLLRKMFGFENASTLGGAAASAALALGAMNSLKDVKLPR